MSDIPSHTLNRGDGDGEQAWLLVRKARAGGRGRGAPDPRRARSAMSGRALAQVAADDGGS